ncbi:hypothetical protein TNCV_4686851 [Trichonephila clavipes]|nr:hypothetical protein TNCV_4686851 [Trichonephila clavipes]
MIARIVQSEECHFGTNNVASIDSTPLTSFQTSSAIKRNHKETTDRSWLEEPTSHFDSSQIRGRYFNADCATHAIKSPPGAIYQQDNARPHTARLSHVFKDMTSYHGLPCHRSFANRACLDAGKATAAVPRYRRINCADAKTMAGSSTGVISDLD